MKMINARVILACHFSISLTLSVATFNFVFANEKYFLFLPNFFASAVFWGRYSFKVSGKNDDAMPTIRQTEPIMNIGIQIPYRPF